MNPLTIQHKQTIIFCDFDGTITENDNIIAIMKHFNPPGWEPIVHNILNRVISIQQGVGVLFELIPSSRKEEVIRFVLENARIRAGFSELLLFCRQHAIPFLVTSGGIDFFVYPILASFQLDNEQIYCNGSDFSGPNIRILWPHACDDHCGNECGMCKTRIIRQYPKNDYYSILIGDSITDFEGAKLADKVFARSHLSERCKELGIPFTPYETFFEVINTLEQETSK